MTRKSDIGAGHYISPMPDLAGFLAGLDLEPAGTEPGRALKTSTWRAPNMDNPGPLVFGGQILAQTVIAAARSAGAHQVKSVHTVFARGAAADIDLDVSVESMHAGRAFSSLSVTVAQGDRLCARSLALCEAEGPDLIRHAPEPPAGGPAAAVPSGHGGAGATSWWEVRTVDGVDISDPEAVGPARLGVWMRFPGAPEDPAVARALLAYASDGFLIGTALRPHPGFGQAQAHLAFDTTVLTHTLTFHEPFSAGDWLFLDHEAPYAGRGRSYGRAHVWTEDGRLVASFVQEAMIRSFPPGRG
jgi:acyl-CoA thioesterase II